MNKFNNLTKVTYSEENRIPDGLMSAPATELKVIARADHTVEAIKDPQEIMKIANYFKERNKRNYLLFICGINFGLRVSDLLRLQFGHICTFNEADGDWYILDAFPIEEKKTATTRKTACNRYVTINDAAKAAIKYYMKNTPGLKADDYLFTSDANKDKGQNKPLNRKSVERILKQAKKDLDLPEKISTHSLRKTFGYQYMRINKFDNRKLTVLQHLFGHSSLNETMRYIGITYEEMHEAYNSLNIGVDFSEVFNPTDPYALNSNKIGKTLESESEEIIDKSSNNSTNTTDPDYAGMFDYTFDSQFGYYA